MSIVILILIIIIIIIIIRLYEKTTNRIHKSKKSLKEKVAILTGGTSGMGLEVATEFARRGAKVIIACPFEEEGVSARNHIIKTTNNEKVVFKLLDLASLKSFRRFTEEILNTEDRLDILVNNAGVGSPKNTKIYNGTNFIMQLNYFGHFLLTLLLLPILKRSGSPTDPSRICNLSSVLHWFGTIDHKWHNKTDIWYRIRCYCNSKFCLALFSYELSNKLKGSNVVVNAVDPGLVGTRIYESVNIYVGIFLRLFFQNVFKTPLEGAQTTLHVALNEDTGYVTGQFFKNCKLSRAKKSAYDDKLADKLWQDSVKIVQLDKSELDQCLKGF